MYFSFIATVSDGNAQGKGPGHGPSLRLGGHTVGSRVGGQGGRDGEAVGVAVLAKLEAAGVLDATALFTPGNWVMGEETVSVQVLVNQCVCMGTHWSELALWVYS